MPTNDVALSSPLYVLVADAEPDAYDYRGVYPDANVNWAFVTNSDIFSAALRLQPWDVILIDRGMIDAIPSELIASVEFEEESFQIHLMLPPEALDSMPASLLEVAGYLLKGPTFATALSRVMRRALYERALAKERSHLTQEIERILKRWEASIRDRTADLERANEQLKAIDRLKSRFLANISHQLRTPLSIIRSYVELLEQCPPDSEEERADFLSIISSETHRLSTMINTLLDLARIEAGRMVWDMREIDIHALVEEVMAPLTPLLERKGIALRSRVRPGMPPIQGDPVRLSQVLGNLIDNSLKHTPEGGHITLDAEVVSVTGELPGELEEYLQLSVTDTGEGIPEAQLEAIFQRFEQLDPDQRGAGLGLAISQEVIHHHGGRIWAEAIEPSGARVLFTIPLAGHLGEMISGGYTRDQQLE